jgi:N-acetyl sugar amidotransferase
MDTSDPEIEFDANGVCNHCRAYAVLVKEHVFVGDEGERRLQRIVDKIRERGRGHKYDCVIGVSGGVDSTYNAYIVKKLGLRPLAVHLDNGWDSEIAACNIERTLNKLGIDLHTHVIDWDEFRDLQLAYLKASVLDMEVLTDHAIAAVLYETASREGTRYILSGGNLVTEAVLPQSWFFNKNDLANLRDIHSTFGTVKLKTYPTLGFLKLQYYRYVKGIEVVTVLDYVPYVKEDVKQFIKQELGWKDYGAKHWESAFTRFYQAYILPTKFGIDKRRAHLSALVCAGQMSREEALGELARSPYTEEELKRDKEYVAKKLGLTDEEFDGLMSLPVRSHFEYRTDVKWQELLNSTLRHLAAAYRVVRRRKKNSEDSVV